MAVFVLLRKAKTRPVVGLPGCCETREGPKVHPAVAARPAILEGSAHGHLPVVERVA
ncbi:hypothetical protein [Gloeobacter violaceus]|uniref:hypothetical protein n=1 Tax=Gloeobacter violaceus TaxID=33072 RepID=UPI0013E8CAED|nr:hypothetical protein [Gloeobacter violaceus]